jgi:hypothetical protein
MRFINSSDKIPIKPYLGIPHTLQVYNTVLGSSFAQRKIFVNLSLVPCDLLMVKDRLVTRTGAKNLQDFAT